MAGPTAGAGIGGTRRLLPPGVSSLHETPLSVLDLAPVVEGSDAATALRNSLDLARHAENLGYRRYWVAEHHNMPGIASSATAVLMGQVAGATERIRVGSGGVMLPNHAPLAVAEQFGTLDALYPDRVDLGLGRAPGTDPRTAAALRGRAGRSADDFPQRLSELVSYFTPDDERPVNAVVAEGNKPEFWLLGSSGFSAQLAGSLGLPFSFAHHFSADNTQPALRAYREAFQPSELLSEPYVLLGASVLCADTDEHAAYLAQSQNLNFLSLRKGTPIALPSPETAANHPYTDLDRAFIEKNSAANIVGSPETVRAQLEQLVADTAADELIITTMAHDHEERKHSYELVASLTRSDS